jgi:DNA-binding transcriptional ArsR family regulator
VAERNKRRAVPLLADFARDRYLPHVRERLRSAANPEAHLRLRILPFLGRKALDEVHQDDVAALRRKLIAEGLSASTVNRHLATLRSMFNLALKWQLYEGRNPAASPGMLPEQNRDRFLTAAETQALVRALDAEPNQDAASALALLILTGARKQEALRAKWELVDFDRCMLTVPLSKNGRPQHILLSPAAGGTQPLILNPLPRPLTVVTGVRVPYKTPIFSMRSGTLGACVVDLPRTLPRKPVVAAANGGGGDCPSGQPGNFRTMLRCHTRRGVVASVAYISRTTGSTFAAYSPATARVAVSPFTLLPATFVRLPKGGCKFNFVLPFGVGAWLGAYSHPRFTQRLLVGVTGAAGGCAPGAMIVRKGSMWSGDVPPSR